jgi:hypothetical protein
MTQPEWWKPKFFQTAFAQIASTVALFTGNLDQGGFVTVTTLVIGLFSAASVVENKLMKPDG